MDIMPSGRPWFTGWYDVQQADIDAYPRVFACCEGETSACFGIGDGVCGGATVDTGCCEVPASLAASLAAPSCAALDGTVIPLTYDGLTGGIHFWSGTFSPGGSCGTLTFQFLVLDGESCKFYMCIKTSGETTVWGDCSGVTDHGAIACPFVSATHGGEGVPTCIVMMGVCEGFLSATVA